MHQTEELTILFLLIKFQQTNIFPSVLRTRLLCQSLYMIVYFMCASYKIAKQGEPIRNAFVWRKFKDVKGTKKKCYSLIFDICKKKIVINYLREDLLKFDFMLMQNFRSFSKENLIRLQICDVFSHHHIFKLFCCPTARIGFFITSTAFKFL